MREMLSRVLSLLRNYCWMLRSYWQVLAARRGRILFLPSLLPSPLLSSLPRPSSLSFASSLPDLSLSYHDGIL